MAIHWIDALSAVRVGLMYALLALAYFLFARTTGTINFAIGGYAMVAGLLYGSVVTRVGVPPVLALVAAVVVATALGSLTEALVIRPIAARHRDEFVVVLAIAALLFVLQQLAGMLFGRRAVVARPLTDSAFTVAGQTVGVHDVITIVLSLAVVVLVGLWVARGRSGRMTRAIGDNEDAARALGIPVQRIRMLTASTAGGIAGLAGALAAPQAGLTIQSGVTLSIVGFIALVIGGTGTAYAPLVGGIVLSVLEAGASLIFGSASRDYLMLAAVLLVFAIRPEGLFSTRVRTT
ncbi:branched-chain amino acid ABC transporter permease [Pseudonocardia kujensis]|uniref:branched-chain amino acid ABC transporter permease n=1 Tax=Pseudonocardia kujensis TaxID=1128675 RepID=UPI001E50814A|nr:branched-chain amino acid ABC transporter permease [Pseudonocardia kujensis]MCE0765078.1 branched-chain amino acid ABC transporter permease [Pseudonocardia kujensis]